MPKKKKHTIIYPAEEGEEEGRRRGKGKETSHYFNNIQDKTGRLKLAHLVTREYFACTATHTPSFLPLQTHWHGVGIDMPVLACALCYIHACALHTLCLLLLRLPSPMSLMAAHLQSSVIQKFLPASSFFSSLSLPLSLSLCSSSSPYLIFSSPLQHLLSWLWRRKGKRSGEANIKGKRKT